MKRSDFRFFHRLRVRWAEIDMQKIVFNGHYLTYIDTAVTAYWGRVALPYETAFHILGGELYVKKATLEYHASALMDDDLRKLPLFVRIARKTAVILWQNIALALSIKAVFIVLTFTGNATMWMAVFADMGASLLVVFNGLRLLRK